jgi:hypothetical protein
MTTATATQAVISHIFDEMTTREAWLGFGYLGERQHATADQADLVAAADQFILNHANAHDWTPADLFAWANSKNGRWFGDVVFGGTGTTAERFADAMRCRLMTLPA